MTIPLNCPITRATLAAYPPAHPWNFFQKIQADHLYATLAAWAGILRFAPRRDCLVSPPLINNQRNSSLWLWIRALCLETQVGITHYAVLRSPDFPPRFHRAATFCLRIVKDYFSFAPKSANLSAPMFSSRGILLTATFLNAEISLVALR